jgi:tetratricopeptide (TPR) repeat protein
MNAGAAKALLLRAHELHAERRIDESIAAAREAIALQPNYVDAWSYLGTTLITRKLAFAEGLAALEQAEALAPDDAGIVYGLGWCYEFVAYRLERQPSTPYRDPTELYKLAAAKLQRCIDLDPEQGLREDAEDLRAAIEVRLEARGEAL